MLDSVYDAVLLKPYNENDILDKLNGYNITSYTYITYENKIKEILDTKLLNKITIESFNSFNLICNSYSIHNSWYCFQSQ